MSWYVVRHAKAGSRSRWEGPDDLRPLTKTGCAQAARLVGTLGDVGIRYVISSPYVRCRQTVEPLAEALRLPVDLSDALAEGAPLSDVVRLVEKYGDDDHVVLCTHGDVVDALLGRAAEAGVDLGPNPRCEKGSTWVIDLRDGEPRAVRYLPPTE